MQTENLNIEFSGNVLRVMLLDQNGKIVSKNEKNIGFSPSDFDQARKNRNEFIAEFSGHMRSILGYELDQTRNAGILIGTDQTFLNVFPLDFNEEQSSIDSHILWELSNYYPESYKDFNIRYLRLNNSNLSQNIDDALLIAVNNNLIAFIKSLCNESNIRIRNIEIDQFTVERCLREFRKAETADASILIIGCKNDRLDYSYVEKGSLKAYDFDIIEDRNFGNSVIRYLNSIQPEIKKVNEIFLYGDKLVTQVKNFIEELVNGISVSYAGIPGEADDPKFSPLYGLALKNLHQ